MASYLFFTDAGRASSELESGQGVEESRRGEGGEQLRKAGPSGNLPPGSAPWSACGPRPQRALDSKHYLCPVVNGSGLPCFQNVVAPTSVPHSSFLAPISYKAVSLRASCPLVIHCRRHLGWPTKLGCPVDGQPGETRPGQEPSCVSSPSDLCYGGRSDSPLQIPLS